VDIERDQIQDPVGELYFPFGKGRDGCRTPMPWISRAPNAAFSSGESWLPIPAAHIERAVDVQEAMSDTVLKFAREAITFRKEHACFLTGDITFLESIGPILAFKRALGEETLTCVFNASEEASVWHGGAASEIVLKGARRLDFGTGDVSLVGTEVICGPRSAAFFKGP